MPSVSVKELQSMNWSDACERVRERVIDMYEAIGDIDDAVKWMWKDVSARQRGES